jgi:prefoldin subunit 5
MGKKAQTELRAIKKEIADIRTKLAALEARKAELERTIKM